MPAGLFHENYRTDERIFQTWFVRSWLIAFLLACVLFPLVASKYMVSVMIEAGIAVIACHGLNLLTGFTGQISLGHSAFMGVGAYTCSILIAHGVPFIVALPAAGAMAALVGMVFGDIATAYGLPVWVALPLGVVALFLFLRFRGTKIVQPEGAPAES